MLNTQEMTRLFVDEMRADKWCRDIIRIAGSDTAAAAERLREWFLYFHDGSSIAEKIMRLAIQQLDWPTMVAAVDAEKKQQAVA